MEVINMKIINMVIWLGFLEITSILLWGFDITGLWKSLHIRYIVCIWHLISTPTVYMRMISVILANASQKHHVALRTCQIQRCCHNTLQDDMKCSNILREVMHLPHWTLRDVAVIFKSNKLWMWIWNSSFNTCFKLLSGECHRISLMRSQPSFMLWLMQCSIQPLPKPMLTQICHHMVSLGHNELKWIK